MGDKSRAVKEMKAAVFGRYGLIAALMVLIAAAVLISVLEPAKAGNPVSVGFVSEPCAYCMYELSAAKDPHCSVTAFSTYDDMTRSLKNGTMDAALLPARYLDVLDAGGLTTVAVTSYLNLVVVECGSDVHSVADLNRRRIVLPEALKGSPEQQMLSALLSRVDISAELLYVSDGAVSQMAWDADFDIMALPPDLYEKALQQNGTLRCCFDLADVWSGLMGTVPPAGCCLVARDAVIAEQTEDVAGVLNGLEASVFLLKTKHKKAAAVMAAAFGDDANNMGNVIPHCQYAYLDGDVMAESLLQLKSLSQPGAVQ